MSLASELAPHLSLLRRYSRALTGSQESGDAYVIATLEAIVAAPETLSDSLDLKTGLYHAFHKIWTSVSIEPVEVDEGIGSGEAQIGARLENLTPPARQAFLLSAMEGFDMASIAAILEIESGEVEDLLAAAIADIDRQTATSVLIIEDEPIIALDLESIVGSLGHTVVDIADTRDTAVVSARTHRPGLVLADIHLADGSSGIDAVKDILGSFDVPVIFITAYPERLLTGERPEPTYLITKPYNEDGVKAAISQALFLHTPA
jgi:DNA-directed RNA polymerase specialized sigma24 family protein/CheY-like chemotaxis protein